MGDFIVSAIVSTYANERFIEGCLNDLLRQSLGNFLEIIVIDSCSPQNEGSIVKRFQEKHSNIVYVRTETRETLYAAWNRGIKMARGKYITSANTDDRLRSDAYAIMARELDNHPEVALVYGDIFVTSLENQTFEKHIRSGVYLQPDYAPAIMLHDCHMGPQPMWRKSLHEELGYFDDTLFSAGDYDFWCRIAMKYPLRHISDFLGLYYFNAQGLEHGQPGRSLTETHAVKDKYKNKLPAPSSNIPGANFYQNAFSPDQMANIGLVARSDGAAIRKTLESLVKNTAYPYVLTVLNVSGDPEIRTLLAQYRQQGIINNLVTLDKEVPSPAAYNLTWLWEPQAAFFIKLDSGVLMKRPQWLNEMVRLTIKIPALGALSYDTIPSPLPLVSLRKRRMHVHWNGGFTSSCLLIPRRVSEKIGYLNEALHTGDEAFSEYTAALVRKGFLCAVMPDIIGDEKSIPSIKRATWLLPLFRTVCRMFKRVLSGPAVSQPLAALALRQRLLNE